MTQRKRRTRGHVIADIGVRYVEYVIVRAGFVSVQAPQGGDYGVDVYMFTFDAEGYQESGQVHVQVRSTERLHVGADGRATVRVERAHLYQWLAEAFPVLLVVYDAAADRATCIDIHARFAGTPPPGTSRTVAIRYDADASFDVQSVAQARVSKNAVVRRIGMVTYDD